MQHMKRNLNSSPNAQVIVESPWYVCEHVILSHVSCKVAKTMVFLQLFLQLRVAKAVQES